MISRRHWLRTYVGFLGTLALAPTTLWATRRRETVLEEWLHRAEAALGDHVVLAQLGATYLDLHPVERGRSRLSHLLVECDAMPIRLQLLEAIAHDWDSHDVIVVEGWVLSRTEARLCAALHLFDGARN